MNYEEMLNAQDGVATHREHLPMGDFYKKLIDRKYRNVVELKPELADSIVFCEALKNEQKWQAGQNARQQMHYELHEDSNGIYELELEQGNFQTLAQLLDNNPAAVAQTGFIPAIVEGLMTHLAHLHAEGICHLCLAPQNIFLRKGDNTPMLLCHGSFYQQVGDMTSFYQPFADFMAPEVLEGGKGDEQSDIYSLGKLVAWLFDQGAMPYEYRQTVRKATAANPAERFKSIDDMRSALTAKRHAKRSLMAFAAALAVALLCLWLYVELMPQSQVVEFVEPAPKTAEEDDPFDYQFDPETAIMTTSDSAQMTEEDREYLAKAEEIFRKRFTAAAERTLSRIYDNKRMGAGEKTFMAGSQSMVEELMSLQNTLAADAGISEEQAAQIGQEIINRITAEKQSKLTHNGYLKESQSEDSL